MERAREAITEALASFPSSPAALLVLACIALEEGNIPEATSTIESLRSAEPMRMEHVLLERLLMYRKREPAAAWSPAFLAAWSEAGHPDFEFRHLLADISLDLHEGEELQRWRDMPLVSVRLLLALVSQPLDPEQARWLLQQIPELDDVALFVATLNVLSHAALPESMNSKAATELQLRLSQLAEAHPGSMQLRLLAYLHGTSEEAPFSAADLATLGNLSELPSWRQTSFEDTFRSARQVFRGIGLPSASQEAFQVASLATMDRGSYLLRKRAGVTRGSLARGSRHPLGRILANVGARMAENSTLLERTLGLLMMQQGAEDAEDPGSMERVAALLDEVYSAQAAWRRAAIDSWPLHSLKEEMLEARAHDENGLLRAFAARPHAP
jgi:hypothetical protein